MSTMPGLGKALKPPEPIGALDELHNALQWLARMSMSFGHEAGSARAAALLYQPARHRFVTTEIAPETALELVLPGLVLQFEEDGRASPHAMDVEEKSSTEIEAWLLCEMLHRGFDRTRFTKDLPYRQERPLTGDERKYAPSEHMEELQQLSDSLVAASAVLLRTKGREERVHLRDDATLACWPERLDIGFDSPGIDGAADLRVGFGLGDECGGRQSHYFVRSVSATVRLITPLELTSVDMAGSSVDEIVERLTSMMTAARVSLAH